MKMRNLLFKVLFASLFGAGSLFSQATQTQTEGFQIGNQVIQYKPGFDRDKLVASAKASDEWLKEVDNGDYARSWDEGAPIFQSTMPKNEWQAYLDKVRKPQGSVSEREIADQRVSKDPKGLPAGDYMVMFYNTKFSSGNNANELVTLKLESDNKWHVMGYYLKTN